ncbi:MAG: Cna domain protein, partial [Bryobacterales bacterium]|nr:Cna domain protein [Bryobacterales bacterium]
ISGGPTFAGISGYPQGRADTTVQANYVLSWIKGQHSLKFGFDYRAFYNNSHNGGTGGQINFSSIATFLAGMPSTTSIQRGSVTPALSIPAYAGFIEDTYKVTRRLTLNLGLRYEYNGVASARHNYLSVFNFSTNTLSQVGADGVTGPYKPDYLDLGPRVGLSWDPFGKSRTVIRMGAGIYYDQPLLSAISGLASNPPFANKFTYTYTGISLANPFVPGSASALAPSAVAGDFKGARVPQYNFNIQHEKWDTVFQIGYIGSAGRRLAVTRDYNQGIGGVRPISGFGPVNVYQSTARASYNALWLSAKRRLSKGLTLDASYTFSKSIDTSSSSSGAQIQDSNNLNAEKALSDFDARQRLVVSLLYQLPGHVSHVKSFLDHWNIALVGNYQSGNPFAPIVSSLRSGSLNAFDRPNIVAGQSLSVANPGPNAWFNAAAFVLNPIGQFGNAGRNILTGPNLRDVDFSLLKNFVLREPVNLQFRGEIFNVTNTPNFGQPGNTVGAANFGVIQTTRSQRGDFGSSRQIEFALKLIF